MNFRTSDTPQNECHKDHKHQNILHEKKKKKKKKTEKEKENMHLNSLVRIMPGPSHNRRLRYCPKTQLPPSEKLKCKLLMHEKFERKLLTPSWMRTEIDGLMDGQTGQHYMPLHRHGLNYMPFPPFFKWQKHKKNNKKNNLRKLLAL